MHVLPYFSHILKYLIKKKYKSNKNLNLWCFLKFLINKFFKNLSIKLFIQNLFYLHNFSLFKENALFKNFEDFKASIDFE